MSPNAIKAAVQRALSGVRSAFMGQLGRVKLVSPIQLASVDGLADETLPDLAVMQQFGLTSSPPNGSHCIVVPLGGRSSASVIVATEHAAYRLKLTDQGEVAIYNQDQDHVWIKRGGHISVKASVNVEIDSPSTTTTGDMVVGGNLAATGTITDRLGSGGKSMDQMRTIYNNHDHVERNVNGGATAKTAQVM